MTTPPPTASGGGGFTRSATPPTAPSLIGRASGAARPFIVRPLQSDTPSPSPPVGTSGNRPPASPGSSSSPLLPSAAQQAPVRAATLAGALANSLRPLQHKLVEISTSVDTLADSVRDILIKVEILARGHERLAGTVQAMQGTVTVGFKDLMDGM